MSNFLSAAECSNLLEWFSAGGTAVEQSEGRTLLEVFRIWGARGTPWQLFLARTHERMLTRIKRVHPAKIYTPTTSTLVQYSAGASIEPHCDGVGLTFLVYLDTLAEGDGGETNFPQLGVKFRPVQGDALLWRTPWGNQENQSGESMHEGVAVKSGVKTIFVVRFR